MAIVETLTVGLGSALAKALVKLWVGDNELLLDATSDLSELLAKAGLDFRARNRISRELGEIAERVADRLEPFFEAEERGGIAFGEQQAAVLAVARTLEHGFTHPSVAVSADLDAQRLEAAVRDAYPSAAHNSLLSDSATRLYDIALRECCAYIITMVENLPRFGGQVFAELLSRNRSILEKLDEALAHLPASTSAEAALDFATRYRREVARCFDQLQLFGLSAETSAYRYRLSVAYITLTAEVTRAAAASLTEDEVAALAGGGPMPYAPLKHAQGDLEVVRVDHVLADEPRTLIRGDAGSGKTTLLQWLAVNASRQTFTGRLASLNGLIPFVVQLRRYANSELPQPEQFIDSVNPMLGSLMPQGWMAELLKDDQALILVDGVDELKADRRDEVRRWLTDLVAAFPGCRVVVTSRPPAVDDDWLSDSDFRHCLLEPMNVRDVNKFIEHWHAAVAGEQDDETALAALQDQLKSAIHANAPLRRLATSPLLCAMLCALSHRGNAHIPEDRGELYRIALEALLEYRDAARNVMRIDLPPLTLRKKTILLQDLAYWLVRNGYSDVPREFAIAQLARSLTSVAPGLDAESVFTSLLLRTGLLREPVVGRVDFIHRTFLEYLAALASVDSGDIGVLVAHAGQDNWSEIIVLAAGCAIREQRHELIESLLDRGDRELRGMHRFHLLAVACLESAPELDPALSERVQRTLEGLVPPKSIRGAVELASAGNLAVGLLSPSPALDAVEARASVRALGTIGTSDALEQICLYGTDARPTVVRELLLQWGAFDPQDYAERVLAESPLEDGGLILSAGGFPAALSHLKRLRHLQIAQDAAPVTVENLAPLTLNSLIVRRDLGIPDLSSIGSQDTLEDLQLSHQQALRSLCGVGRYRALKRLRVEDCGPIDSICEDDEALPRGLTSLAITGQKALDIEPCRGLSINDLRLGCERLTGSETLSTLSALRYLTLIDVKGPLSLEALTDVPALKRLRLVHCTGPIDAARIGSVEQPLEELTVAGCPDLCRPRALGAFGRVTKVRLIGPPSPGLVELHELEPSTLVLGGHDRTDLDGFPPTVSRAQVASHGLSSISGLIGSELRELTLSGAKRLVDFSPLLQIESLEFLSVGGRTPDAEVIHTLRRRGCRVMIRSK